MAAPDPAGNKNVTCTTPGTCHWPARFGVQFARMRLKQPNLG